MVTVKYFQKNFWGTEEFRVDSKKNATYNDIKRAFRFLTQSNKNTIEIKNMVFYWDTLTDFEYKTLTVREFSGNSFNYKEYSWDYDGCKKYYYDMYKNL